jgi:hypothetical protein
LATILCFTFRRFKSPLPNWPQKKRRNTATVVRRSGSFSLGTRLRKLVPQFELRAADDMARRTQQRLLSRESWSCREPECPGRSALAKSKTVLSSLGSVLEFRDSPAVDPRSSAIIRAFPAELCLSPTHSDKCDGGTLGARSSGRASAIPSLEKTSG